MSQIKKVLLIDVLDDPEYNIGQIFREAIEKCGYLKNVLSMIDGTKEELPSVSKIKEVGIIISGSVHSVLENLEWMQKLSRFIRDIEKINVPLLGVCFGHQIISYALGGEIEKNPKGREIGAIPIYLTSEGKKSVLLRGLNSKDLTMLSHIDHVLKLPKKAVRLAFNDRTPNQAFKLGNSWGIQWHPEMTVEILSTLIKHRKELLIEEGVITNDAEFHKIIDNLKDCPNARNILGNFIKFAMNFK